LCHFENYVASGFGDGSRHLNPAVVNGGRGCDDPRQVGEDHRRHGDRLNAWRRTIGLHPLRALALAGELIDAARRRLATAAAAGA
jgi:hypothetical protein